MDGAQHATLKQNRFNTCATPIHVHNALLGNTYSLVDQQIAPKITGGSANLLQKYFVAQPDPQFTAKVFSGPQILIDLFSTILTRVTLYVR